MRVLCCDFHHRHRGAKLNVDQLRKEAAHRLPIPKLIAVLIGCLVIASAIYHTLRWEN